MLNAEEASAWLKLPKSTLYKLCTEGKNPAAKVGRHWRFHRETLEQWLLACTKAKGWDGPGTKHPKKDTGNGAVD